MFFHTGERIQNCQNEEKSLDVAHYCTRIKDKVNVVLELKPVEPPVRRYGPTVTETPRVVPMRLVCVIDVSHSMEEPYGPDEDVSKLDKVKVFAQLLIQSMQNEDYLSIVTFGTKSKVVYPMERMSPENKGLAQRSIDQIQVGGVTNMSAGVFTAIEQFNTNFAKSRYFDDNIVLFTDGMANEGVIDTDDMIKEIRKRVHALKEECHFERDYAIKLCTLGTSGFLPELLFRVGQEFSSDAFYFLDESANLELNLMKPVLLRQSSLVSSVKVTVDALNGVVLDKAAMSSEYEQHERTAGGEVISNSTKATYLIHDICVGMERHIIFTLTFPIKHKKLLKGKDVLKIVVSHRNSTMEVREVEVLVPYEEVPRKEHQNREHDIAVTACQESRVLAHQTLDQTAALIMKLDRTHAKETLEAGVTQIRDYLEVISPMLTSEESHALLLAYVDPIVHNLENCSRFLMDYTVRWDDAWGRLKALSSSVAREVPTACSVYAEGADLFSSPKVEQKLDDLFQKLKDIYGAMGFPLDVLDRYFGVMKELEKKIGGASDFSETSV